MMPLTNLRKVVYESDQFLDYFLSGLLLNDDTLNVHIIRETLKNRGIYVSVHKIEKRYKELKEGQDLPQPASEFNDKVCGRYGKSLAYEGLWAIADVLLPDYEDRYYIGLPANQITTVARHCGHNCLTILEHNNQIYQKSLHLAQWSINKQPNLNIIVINKDIWQFLEETKNKFNIFDLDLMCHTSPELVKHWARLITKSSMNGINLILLVNSIGNGLFEEQYEEHFNLFLEALAREGGIEVIGCSSIKHRDRKIPMRSQRVVINKEDKIGETND